MPTLNATRNKVDQWIGNAWPLFQARQEEFLTVNGRYWQGLWSHTFDLLYTNNTDAEIEGNNLGSRPTDVTVTWNDFIPEWTHLKLPMRLVCDVYQTPAGQWGYAVTLTFRHNGILWARVLQHGPETSRAQPWTQVSE